MSPRAIIIVATASILAIMILSACSKADLPQPIIDVVDTSIPVLQKDEAPKELFDRSIIKKPVFVSPTNPAATSCLTAPGEGNLKDVILMQNGHLNAWEKWAIQ